MIDAANVRPRKTLEQILHPVLKPLGYKAVVKTQPFSATSCFTKTEAINRPPCMLREGSRLRIIELAAPNRKAIVLETEILENV